MPITDDQLLNWFSYHAPQDSDEVECYEVLRNAGLALSRTIIDLTPTSADQTAAIRKVREAIMTANAAIACGGK